MDQYTVKVEPEVKPGEINAIVSGLLEFNARHTGGDTPKYLVVSLKDTAGELVGGLVGLTYLGWLHVQAFWLPDELRGRGHGQAILAIAEAEAVKRGSPRVFLETLSFQALGFYEKCGYTVVSELPDFPMGGARYALTKQLAKGEERLE